MRGKKLLSILAVLAAVSGAAIAVGKYLKNKGINIKNALDYKNNIFSEDEYDEDLDLAELQPLDDEAGEASAPSAGDTDDSDDSESEAGQPSETDEQDEADEGAGQDD